MANPCQVKTFRTALSKDFSTLVTAVSAFLAASRIEIIDIAVTRRTLTNRTDDTIIRVLYRTFPATNNAYAGRWYTARAFRHTAGDTQTVEQAIGAYYGIPANVTQGGDGFLTPRWVIDCTGRASGKSATPQYLVIAEKYGTSDTRDFSLGLGSSNAVLLGAATAAIAPRTLGTVQVKASPTANGPLLTNIRNLSYTDTWTVGMYGWVLLDSVDGAVVGLPSGIVAWPESPVRSFFAMSFPRLLGAAIQSDVPKMEYPVFALPFSPRP